MNLSEPMDKWVAKVDALSMRERVLIFAAVAFLLVSLVEAVFLRPLLDKQKKIATQVSQQQEKMKEVQAKFAELTQANEANVKSPLHERARLLRQQLADGDAYLKSRRDKLVPPEKMAALLEQMLNRNARLQLVAMETLPPSLLLEPANEKADGKTLVQSTEALPDKQIYKHGVKLTVRGSYADLLQYVTALEHMPTQMFWGVAKMEVVKHPTVELTLTLYTLSLDKTWLQV